MQFRDAIAWVPLLTNLPQQEQFLLQSFALQSMVSTSTNLINLAQIQLTSGQKAEKLFKHIGHFNGWGLSKKYFSHTTTVWYEKVSIKQ